MSNIKRLHWRTQERGAAGLQLPAPKAKFKNTDFVNTVSRAVRDFRSSVNQPAISADDQYTETLQNVIKS